MHGLSKNQLMTSPFTAQKENAFSDLSLFDQDLFENVYSRLNLLVYLDERAVRFITYSPKNKKFLGIESFSNKEQSFAEFLSISLKENSMLKSLRFSKTTVISGFGAPVFTPSSLKLQSDVFFPFEPGVDEVSIEKNIPASNINCRFTIPNEAESLLKTGFDSFEFYHQSIPLIHSQISSAEKSNHKILVCVRKNVVDVCITFGQQLLLFNTFKFETEEDLVYHLLNIIQQLKIDEYTMRLCGEIFEASSSYSFLKKYFKVNGFSQTSPSVKFSSCFDQISTHQFFSAFSFTQCES